MTTPTTHDARLLADCEHAWWFEDGDLCEPMSVLGRGIRHISREAGRLGYPGHERSEVDAVIDRWFGGSP